MRKISFVIPAYNEQDYIGKCLDSVISEINSFRQNDSGFDFEIVVVNNASTDRTRGIVSVYKGVKIVDEPRKGLVIARRAGFVKSSGELVANIDADAVLPAGWLKKVADEFGKNPDLVCLSGPHVHYDLPLPSRIIVKIWYGLGFLLYILNKRVLKIGSMVQGGNFVVRRSALEKAGGFNTSINFYGEDTDIARRLSKIGDVKFTFSLPIYISGRRLAHEGILTVGYHYAINYFWITYFKKPFHESAKDLRPKPADNSR